MRTLLPLMILAGCGSNATVSVFAGFDKRIDAGDWVVDITRWVTVVDHIQLSNRRGRVLGDDGEARIVLDFINLPYAVELATFDTRTGTNTVNFGIEPPVRTDPRGTRFITELEVVNMEANGWTHLIDGRAFGPSDIYSKTPIYSFSLQFDAPVRNLGCGEVDIVGGEDNQFMIENDMDPWLWTAGTAENPEVSFVPLSLADANRDLDITADELRGASLSAVNVEGDAPNLYQHLRENLFETMVGPGDCETRNGI